MRRHRLLHLLLLAGAAVVAGCCEEGPANETTAQGFHVDGGHVVLDLEGVRVEVDGVPYVYRQVASSGENRTTSTLAGRPFGVRDGVFFVGPRTYGGTEPGSVVRVTAEGVEVDGTPRGALPPVVDDGTR